VFGRIFGFFVRGATASVEDLIAFDLLQEGLAAVAHAAFHDAHGAPLTDLRPGRPVGRGRKPAALTERGLGGFGGGAGEVGERRATGRKQAHDSFTYRTFAQRYMNRRNLMRNRALCKQRR